MSPGDTEIDHTHSLRMQNEYGNDVICIFLCVPMKIKFWANLGESGVTLVTCDYCIICRRPVHLQSAGLEII